MKNKVYVNTTEQEYYVKTGQITDYGAAGLSFEKLMALCIEWNVHYAGREQEIEVVLETIPDKIEEYTLMYQYQIDAARKKESNLVSKEFNKFIDESGNEEKLKAAICILDGGIETRDIWKKFNHSYARFNSLFRNREFYREYFMSFLTECYDDNITTVDMRLGFEEFDNGTTALHSTEQYLRYSEGFSLDRYLYFKDLAVNVPRADQVEETQVAFLNQILSAFEDSQCVVKVILTANRNININDAGSLARLTRKVDLAIAIKEGNLPATIPNIDKLKNLVVGFDFVNQEDHGYSTDAYKSIIYGIPEEHLNTARIQNIDFYLHDGESCWKMAPNMKEPKYASVIEACVISKYRVGHGLTMAQYPELIAAIQNGVGASEQILPTDPAAPFLLLPILEINPISNQLLKYCPDLRVHPMPQLMKSGINCVLSNDDPLILDNPGLSYDFWISIMDMELTYEMVKKLVFVTYAFTEIRPSLLVKN